MGKGARRYIQLHREGGWKGREVVRNITGLGGERNCIVRSFIALKTLHHKFFQVLLHAYRAESSLRSLPPTLGNQTRHLAQQLNSKHKRVKSINSSKHIRG